MSQPESRLRSRVIKALKGLHPTAIEHPVIPGTPDVWCVPGWIELKLVAAPVRKDSLVRVPHYSPHQKLWARQCISAGGSCWFLIQIGAEVLLLDGMVAAKWVGSTNLEGLKAVSLKWWPGLQGLDRDLRVVLERYNMTNRTQYKVMVTQLESLAYTQQAQRFDCSMSTWCVQVLRRASFLPSMDPPNEQAATLISMDAYLDHQIKIRLTKEEVDATESAWQDSGEESWSAWVREQLRGAARVI